jgi:hypothetical protein
MTTCPAVVRLTVPSGPAVARVAVPSGPAVARVATPGPPGPSGSAGYVHNQPSASTTWTIPHNLGFKPAVELLNTGSQEIEADVVHTSANTCLVYFTTPTAGFARLN